jgi:hypothetical protein
MYNITVVIGDDCYRRARVWAAQHDTSLSAVVRHLLEALPGITRAAKAFPVSNMNPANFPTAGPSAPNQKAAISKGETVDQNLTHSVSNTSASPSHGSSQTVNP